LQEVAERMLMLRGREVSRVIRLLQSNSQHTQNNIQNR
jgi:hypothetical protein